MPTALELHGWTILACVTLIEGCSYYGCKDDLKRDFVPLENDSRWLDDRTLEIDFGRALWPADEVDPRRFALLRYNVEITDGNDYYCSFELCYREIAGFAEIPESLSWDPGRPSVLRLNFADPIPADACEPWPGTWADYQALDLIYINKSFGEPDRLGFGDAALVEDRGPDQALDWLENCFAGGACDFEDFCLDNITHYDPQSDELWIDCP